MVSTARKIISIKDDFKYFNYITFLQQTEIYGKPKNNSPINDESQGNPNLALRKRSCMSSTFDNNPVWYGSWLAFDGNLGTSVDLFHQCAHTNDRSFGTSWLAVDLELMAELGLVKVLNRNGDTQGEILIFKLFLLHIIYLIFILKVGILIINGIKSFTGKAIANFLKHNC